MAKAIKRCTSFLLVLMLVVTMLPAAYAAEVSGDSTTATEETISETTSETTVSTMPEDATDVSQPPSDETGDPSPSTEETEPTVATDSTESTEPESDSTETDPTEATAPVEETQPEMTLEEPVIVTDEYGVMLIYEIVCGLRDPITFTTNSTNECGTSGYVFYQAGESSVPNFASKYNALVSYVQSALKIPSFTSKSSDSAPTITLTGDETSVYDSNGVLSNFSFADGDGAGFYKSGNTLYINQTGNISESTVFRATRNVPSASGATYNLWYSATRS